MFRHLSNPALFAAFALFGLSGGLTWASCGTSECELIHFKSYDNDILSKPCTQYHWGYAAYVRSTNPDGGTQYCGSGNEERHWEKCNGAECGVPELPYTVKCDNCTGERDEYEPLENCACIPDS